MKKQVKYLIFTYIISIIVSFILGFFVTNLVNNERGIYVSNFSYVGEKELNFNEIINEDFLNSVKENHPNLSLEEINVKKMLENNDFTITNNEDKTYTITTKIKYYETSYLSKSSKILNRSETFIKYALIDFTSDKDSIVYTNGQIGEIQNTFSTWIGGLIGLGVGLLITTIIIIILPQKTNKNDNIEEFLDNENVFKNPLKKKYWLLSLKELKSTKQIVILGMLFALYMISRFISLPSGFGNLGLNFGILIQSVICTIYGPIISLGVGFFGDILGHFIKPSGYGFHFGYTIQAMLACFTYAICLYRSRITFSRVLLSRIIINLLLNVVYGSYLMMTLFLQGGSITPEGLLEGYKVYALMYSLPKNIVYLLPQSILIFIIIKTVAPTLERMGCLPTGTSKNISLI
jgi:ECF transporter S component (folate family)